MDLLGKTLGNYRIDRLLGEGGMGTVYQAYDLSLQREVAIKLIHPHLARLLHERFIQEARLMARLDHPGIVKVYMLGKEGDLLFIPMEFIKGGNLRQLLDKMIQEGRWLPLHEALLIVQQLCEIVEYAHQHGVLHRDIKPANLMLKPEPYGGLPFRIILTDLGLGKLVEGLGMTQEGTSMGTPAYMSPEQALGQETDPRSDVYSLGVLLYELAVGRLPFQIRSITEATRYHIQVQPPAPRSIRPELPEALERVILKALEKDPGKRYSSAAELGAALAGTMNLSTEIIDQANQYGIASMSQPALASLMTVLGDEAVEPRGASVFAGQSVAPSSQTRIQIIQKNETAMVLPLPSGTVTIGRDQDNHIVLDDNKASRKHAQITWDGMEYYVMDLGSTNGTYLENTRLLPGVAEVWKPNQNIRIGGTWLRLLRSIEDAKSVTKSTIFHTSVGVGLVGVSVTPQQLSVEAGGSVTATISLLNQSPNVDHFSLSLSGIPNTWIVSLPSTVQLMPGEQKETEFTLLIPRSPQSRAGPHPMTLMVSSQRDPSQFVEVKLTLTIAAYSQFRAELQPQRLRAGRTGHVSISSQGNIQETFTVQFKDAANEFIFQPPQLEVNVPEGGSATAEYRALMRQPRLLGGEKSHSFSAQVSLPKGEPQTLQAEMISRGLFPAWVPPFLLLLCLALFGIAALLGAQVPASMHANQTATALVSDLDNDELNFGAEAALGCNPDNPDTDGDGLLDSEEKVWGTDCTVRDSDHDNLTDGEEVHSKKTNPMNPDTDGDQLPDNVDPAPGALPTFTPSPAPTTPSVTPITPSLTPTLDEPTPTFTPPPAPRSQKIAFVSYRDGNAEIYVMNADGSNPSRLTSNNAADYAPDWSPDGSKIAFISSRDGNDEIYVMNADGSNQIGLTIDKPGDYAPDWSPDGSKIAFYYVFPDGNFEIYVMNADGGNKIRLTDNNAVDSQPTWSPDGSKIAFFSTRDGNAEIYVMNADGSNPSRLTSNNSDDYAPAWSSDGSRIAFVSQRDGNTEIYVMNADGGNEVRLTNNDTNDNYPSWSPNGRKITFSSDRDGNAEIYVMNADGGNQSRLTNNNVNDTEPDWSR